MTTTSSISATTTVTRVSPEDLQVGDYVSLSRVTIELISDCDEAMSPPKVHRVSIMPECAGFPLRVREICLPFVLVKTPHGKIATLDVRQQEVVRLNPGYGRSSYKAYRKMLRTGDKTKKSGSGG